MVNHIELALMQDDELSRASSSSSAAGVVQQSGQQGCGGSAIGGNDFVALEDRPTNASYSSRRGTPGNKNVGVFVEEYEKASSCTDCCSGSEWSNDGDHGASDHGDLFENNINNAIANEKTRVMTESDEKNPWSKEYFGIPVNYFSVGVIFGGSVSVLYPLLVIQHGVTASFYAASASLVTLFWSYKILFGLCCDVFPIRGQKWKPYIILGWAVCASMLVILASLGEDVSPVHLVIMLTFANLGYVAADVAADGMMVWMAHHETTARRGKIQSLIYIFRNFGRIFINLVIIFAFSGPAVNCPGYEKDRDVPCTTDESVVIRNDLADELPDTWCYQQCDGAQFAFGLTIPQFAWLIAAVNLVSIPSYFMLKEEKKPKESISQVASNFWTVMKKRPVWQVMLYKMISSITFDVYIVSKQNANHTWLGLSTLQNQIVNIMEAVIFTVGLGLVRQYGLDFSWRKMIWIGSMLVTIFNGMYLLIVYDIIRNPYFYMFTDFSDTFMYVLNFTASVFAIVEVSESGFEAITYALITTASNATGPLSTVISFQFMSLFPSLNTQEGLASDTPEVRHQFALLILIVECINLSSLLALPMLPRQKKEMKELVAKGETSCFWALFTLISAGIFLIYSTLVTFMTVGATETMGCSKILGGSGCTEDESSIPVYFLMGILFLYCYGLNFYFTFWPILSGREKFSFDMFF